MYRIASNIRQRALYMEECSHKDKHIIVLIFNDRELGKKEVLSVQHCYTVVETENIFDTLEKLELIKPDILVLNTNDNLKTYTDLQKSCKEFTGIVFIEPQDRLVSIARKDIIQEVVKQTELTPYVICKAIGSLASRCRLYRDSITYKKMIRELVTPSLQNQMNDFSRRSKEEILPILKEIKSSFITARKF